MFTHRRSQCLVIIIQTTDGFVVIVWVLAAIRGTFHGWQLFISKDLCAEPILLLFTGLEDRNLVTKRDTC